MLQKTSAGTKADEDEDKKKSNSFYFDEESPNFGDSYFTCNLYKGVYAGVCFDISKLGKKQKKLGCFRPFILRIREAKI